MLALKEVYLKYLKQQKEHGDEYVPPVFSELDSEIRMRIAAQKKETVQVQTEVLIPEYLTNTSSKSSSRIQSVKTKVVQLRAKINPDLISPDQRK